MTDTIEFQTNVDLAVEKASLLAYYSDFLLADRQIPPRLTLYRGNEHIVSVECRSFEGEADEDIDRNRAMMEAMYLVPAIMPDLSLLSFAGGVYLQDTGPAAAIIVVAMNRTGALAEVIPWDIKDDRVIYNEEAKLDPAFPIYNTFMQNMMPTFVRTRRSAFAPTELVGFLSERGHTVTMHNDWTMTNIDPRSF